MNLIIPANCPFCGAKPYAHVQSSYTVAGDPSKYLQVVWCDDCGAQGPHKDTKASAIAAWNSRALSQAPMAQDIGQEGVVVALGEALDVIKLLVDTAPKVGSTSHSRHALLVANEFLALTHPVPADPSPREGEVKRLDPDMPAAEIRLHMGEMTAQEMRTARAAIRWANSALSGGGDE